MLIQSVQETHGDRGTNDSTAYNETTSATIQAGAPLDVSIGRETVGLTLLPRSLTSIDQAHDRQSNDRTSTHGLHVRSLFLCCAGYNVGARWFELLTPPRVLYDAGPPIRRVGRVLMTPTSRHRKAILQVMFLMSGRVRIFDVRETVK